MLKTTWTLFLTCNLLLCQLALARPKNPSGNIKKRHQYIEDPQLRKILRIYPDFIRKPLETFVRFGDSFTHMNQLPPSIYIEKYCGKTVDCQVKALNRYYNRYGNLDKLFAKSIAYGEKLGNVFAPIQMKSKVIQGAKKGSKVFSWIMSSKEAKEYQYALQQVTELYFKQRWFYFSMLRDGKTGNKLFISKFKRAVVAYIKDYYKEPFITDFSVAALDNIVMALLKKHNIKAIPYDPKSLKGARFDGSVVLSDIEMKKIFKGPVEKFQKKIKKGKKKIAKAGKDLAKNTEQLNRAFIEELSQKIGLIQENKQIQKVSLKIHQAKIQTSRGMVGLAATLLSFSSPSEAQRFAQVMNSLITIYEQGTKLITLFQEMKALENATDALEKLKLEQAQWDFVGGCANFFTAVLGAVRLITEARKKYAEFQYFKHIMKSIERLGKRISFLEDKLTDMSHDLDDKFFVVNYRLTDVLLHIDDIKNLLKGLNNKLNFSIRQNQEIALGVRRIEKKMNEHRLDSKEERFNNAFLGCNPDNCSSSIRTCQSNFHKYINTNSQLRINTKRASDFKNVLKNPRELSAENYGHRYLFNIRLLQETFAKKIPSSRSKTDLENQLVHNYLFVASVFENYRKFMEKSYPTMPKHRKFCNHHDKSRSYKDEIDLYERHLITTEKRLMAARRFPILLQNNPQILSKLFNEYQNSLEKFERTLRLHTWKYANDHFEILSSRKRKFKKGKAVPNEGINVYVNHDTLDVEKCNTNPSARRFLKRHSQLLLYPNALISTLTKAGYLAIKDGKAKLNSCLKLVGKPQPFHVHYTGNQRKVWLPEAFMRFTEKNTVTLKELKKWDKWLQTGQFTTTGLEFHFRLDPNKKGNTNSKLYVLKVATRENCRIIDDRTWEDAKVEPLPNYVMSQKQNSHQNRVYDYSVAPKEHTYRTPAKHLSKLMKEKRVYMRTLHKLTPIKIRGGSVDLSIFRLLGKTYRYLDGSKGSEYTVKEIKKTAMFLPSEIPVVAATMTKESLDGRGGGGARESSGGAREGRELGMDRGPRERTITHRYELESLIKYNFKTLPAMKVGHARTKLLGGSCSNKVFDRWIQGATANGQSMQKDLNDELNRNNKEYKDKKFKRLVEFISNWAWGRLDPKHRRKILELSSAKEALKELEARRNLILAFGYFTLNKGFNALKSPFWRQMSKVPSLKTILKRLSRANNPSDYFKKRSQLSKKAKTHLVKRVRRVAKLNRINQVSIPKYSKCIDSNACNRKAGYLKQSFRPIEFLILKIWHEYWLYKM